MSEEELYALTPGETVNRVDAWRWLEEQIEERVMHREAWKLANLLTPYSKKPLKASQFLEDDTVPEHEKFDELERRIDAQRR